MRLTAPHGGLRARVAAVCAGALAATGIALVNAGGATADDFPGQDQIAAARAAADSQAATVDQLDAVVVALEQALSDAEAAQLIAADQYSQAVADLDAANANLDTANSRSAQADAALSDAQSQLAAVAQAAYRDGGTMGQLSALMTATGFEDAVNTSEALTRASDEMATLVQRVQAAQIVADTMRQAAADAAVAAAQAAQQASDAYDNAVAAADAAARAVTAANEVRDDAVARLAELQGTTVELEQERQAGLKAEREKQERAAAKAAQEQAEKDLAAEPVSKTQDPAPTKTDDPAPTKTDDPAPTKTDDPAPTKTDDPAPTKTQDPEPTKTDDPAPTKTDDPAPTKTQDPEPTKTQDPEPAPASGAWKSSAAQGEAAAAKALTLMGLPYKYGAAGPSSYDCSGLTMVAWKAAGLSIQRSSQAQYNTTTHVAFSQLRKGDLIFYGTNRDPKKIYHVTIYIGNGMVAEATSPGKVSQVRPYDASWRINDLIAVVGRP